MKPSKKMKLIIGLILAIIVLGVTFKGVLDRKLVFEEVTITTGCMIEFCIGDSKEEVVETVKVVLAMDNVKLVYKNTNTPTHSPDDLNYEKLLKDDLWTIIVEEKFGFSKFYYLYYDGNILSKIDIAKYGPFYIDL